MGHEKSKFALTGAVKLSEENALKQMMLLVNRYGLDIESIEDGKEKNSTEKMLNNILRSIMREELEVFEEDVEVKVRQLIKHKSEKSTVSELVYRELTSEHQSAMSIGEDVTQYDQINDLMISMCEAENADFVIKRLKSSDLKNMEYLGLFFLAQ